MFFLTISIFPLQSVKIARELIYFSRQEGTKTGKSNPLLSNFLLRQMLSGHALSPSFLVRLLPNLAICFSPRPLSHFNLPCFSIILHELFSVNLVLATWLAKCPSSNTHVIKCKVFRVQQHLHSHVKSFSGKCIRTPKPFISSSSPQIIEGELNQIHSFYHLYRSCCISSMIKYT